MYNNNNFPAFALKKTIIVLLVKVYTYLNVEANISASGTAALVVMTLRVICVVTLFNKSLNKDFDIYKK